MAVIKFLDRYKLLHFCTLLIIGYLTASWLYAGLITGFPYSDTIYQLQGRTQLSGFSDFIKTIWHERHAEDFFAYRPGFVAYNLLIDQFFRANLVFQKNLIIFIHSVNFSIIGLILAKLRFGPMGLVFGLVYLVQYTSVSAIFWHHINPYVLSITFMLLSYLCILHLNNCSAQKNKITLFMAALLLFFSGLLHESVGLSVVIFTVLGIFIFKKNSFIIYWSGLFKKAPTKRLEKSQDLPKGMIALILASVFYTCLYISNYIYFSLGEGKLFYLINDPQIDQPGVLVPLHKFHLDRKHL